MVKIRLQCGRPGFNAWVGKIPWRRKWPPTPVFWLGEFHGLYSPRGSQRIGHNWETFTTHAQAVHLQRKDKRKALSSHFWLTFKVCTTRKSGRVENCLVELWRHSSQETTEATGQWDKIFKLLKEKLPVNNYISDLTILQNEVEISQGKSRTKGFIPELYQHVKKKVSILFKLGGERRESFPISSVISVITWYHSQTKTRKLH